MKLYGIKNCDTVKKARRWLETNAIDYQFHDLREQGLDRAMIDQWLQSVDISQLLNKRSTTWKNLDASVRDDLQEGDIPDLLVTNPTLVKRPVLEQGGKAMVGFNDKTYSTFFDL